MFGGGRVRRRRGEGSRYKQPKRINERAARHRELCNYEHDRRTKCVNFQNCIYQISQSVIEEKGV